MDFLYSILIFTTERNIQMKRKYFRVILMAIAMCCIVSLASCDAIIDQIIGGTEEDDGKPKLSKSVSELYSEWAKNVSDSENRTIVSEYTVISNTNAGSNTETIKHTDHKNGKKHYTYTEKKDSAKDKTLVGEGWYEDGFYYASSNGVNQKREMTYDEFDDAFSADGIYFIDKSMTAMPISWLNNFSWEQNSEDEWCIKSSVNKDQYLSSFPDGIFWYSFNAVNAKLEYEITFNNQGGVKKIKAIFSSSLEGFELINVISIELVNVGSADMKPLPGGAENWQPPKNDEDTGDDNTGDNNTGNEPDTPGNSWNQTTIRFELTKDNAAQELESGCERYYAGGGLRNPTDLDLDVRVRNINAATASNVKVQFTYAGYASNETGWGENIDRFVRNAASSATDNPDIYCNYAYDLTCAQLRGAFYNLKDTQDTRGNWFSFTDEDYNPVSDNYFDSEAGEGYLYEYMESLALSDDKMYILASNYTIDAMRAMLVVPVNISMLNEFTGKNSYTGDMNDYTDFYDLVWRSEDRSEAYQEGWTYDVLADYSNRVYVDNPGDSPLADKVGFIAGCTSGSVSSGFLYSADVYIIKKTANGDGSYTFEYPETCDALNVFAEEITGLFTENAGILTVTSSEATAYDAAAKNDITMIRNKFANDEVLFGGIVALGSLEEDAYQSMRYEGDGFGILPVPLYRSVDEDGNREEYRTLIHSIARVTAISKATTEFSQCTAYLEELSKNSANIFTGYINEQFDLGDAKEENLKMATFIRNHAVNCFDKTIEDAICNFYSDYSYNWRASRWHEYLGNANRFNCPSFTTAYENNRDNKQYCLGAIVDDWNEN